MAKDIYVFLCGLLPMCETHGIWVLWIERDEFDVGFGQILLFQTIHSPFAIFLHKVKYSS